MMTGGIIFLVMLIKAGMDRTGIPSLVGYLILGFCIRLADSHWGLSITGYHEILKFLAKIGLITLLFRVGLESNLRGLLGQLRRASMVWVCDVAISGLVGLVAAFYVLGFPWITSLVIAAAFTATSVGVSVAVWEGRGALNSSEGQLLLDVAEMDDISAVVIMALLFSILPMLKDGSHSTLFPMVSKTFGLFTVKLIFFGAICFLFSQFAEKKVAGFFRNLESPPDPMIVVVAIGFVIAAISDILGFSLAIGAFFAGLVFSRDPETIKMESSFLPLYDFFSPFFFIGIGLDIDPEVIGIAWGIGIVLFVAAIVSKLIADGIPVFFLSGLGSGILIGASMVPRAEIAMIIMQRGLNLGEWAVTARAFAAMVVVSAATCIISPLAVRVLLARRFQEAKSNE